ncbi:MAG TPA: GNAT family N-acetyltransferase [Acidimicrobiales bacterium]|nr:GNAT family N-acetyltransferase [Acidimicrobiales bacterium]
MSPTTTSARAPLPDIGSVRAGELTLVRCRPEQWQVLRRLHLDMLDEAPELFAERPSLARTRSPERWRELARRGAGHGRGEAIWFAMTPAGGAVATMAARLTADGDATLSSCWVEPDWRCRGIATGLIVTAEGWATALGAPRISTWVADRNVPGRALLRRCGYVDTPVRMVLARDHLVEHVVTKVLAV